MQRRELELRAPGGLEKPKQPGRTVGEIIQRYLNDLNVMAKATGRTRGTLMTHAIERYVENEAWQVAAIQEAVDELERGEGRLY